MYKNKKGEGSRGKKRKAEDEYSLKTILEDEASNDDGGEVVEPRAAARNAEKNDESVRFRNISQSLAVFNDSSSIGH